MTLRRAALALALTGAALALPREAVAFDVKVGGEHLRLDLTESMFLSAHLDNDGNPNGDKSDENYGEIINRLNAQLAWRRFLFSIRFDTGLWFHTPSQELLDTQKYASDRFLGPGFIARRGPAPMGVRILVSIGPSGLAHTSLPSARLSAMTTLCEPRAPCRSTRSATTAIEP